MLPRDFTYQISLNPEQDCKALTFSARLDPKTFEILDVEIEPTITRIQRVTYGEVEQLLSSPKNSSSEPEKENIIRRLEEITIGRAALRAKGEVSMNTTVKVDKNTGLIYIHDLRNQQRSRAIVEEAMVLAGELCARFAIENQVPIAFRVMPQMNSPDHPENLELPDAGSYVNEIRKNFFSASATNSAYPILHSKIGLSCYSRATSPVRRYCDIVTHYQINAYLKGGRNALPWQDSDLENSVFPLINYTSKKIDHFDRSMQNFWLWHFFVQEGRRLHSELLNPDSDTTPYTNKYYDLYFQQNDYERPNENNQLYFTDTYKYLDVSLNGDGVSFTKEALVYNVGPNQRQRKKCSLVIPEWSYYKTLFVPVDYSVAEGDILPITFNYDGHKLSMSPKIPE